MNICHISQYCHPMSSGGTERFIADLVRGLSRHGANNCIGWLDSAGRTEPFDADGTPVIPLPHPATRFDPPPVGCHRAAETLFACREPDVLHFHTFGRTEAVFARLAREHGIPYLFTYHSPGWSCREGSLLRWGRERCDGEVRTWRCSACKLQQRLRCPPWIAALGTALSAPPGALFLWSPGGNLRRQAAFLYDSLFMRREFREFLSRADLTVSCCKWSVPLLEINGTPADRLVVCPQGVPLEVAIPAPPPPHRHRDTFTIGFVGRLDPVKGAHILVDAFCRTSYPAARLKIFGWYASRQVTAYARRVETTARGDSRIVLAPTLPFSELLEAYRDLDLLAIPSDWPETGPLVMLEAFGVGVPVWGSDFIGQLDLLRERGRVIAPNTTAAWHEALEEAFLMHQRHEWCRWADARAKGTLRTMQDTADEMLAHYRSLRKAGRECKTAVEEPP